MPFQQRTNTSCYLAIPTHGFTVVLSVFRGTPPAKPLNCKSVSNRLGARIRSVWAHHTGGTPRHSCPSSIVPLAGRRTDAAIRLALSDIIKTSLSYRSQTVHLSFLRPSPRFQGNKKPRLRFVSRVKENLSSLFRTCLHRVYPNYLRAAALRLRWIAQG
jgi:hypothetical protein